ncbi:hypothetical protein M9H77_22939 [Catharanthus roseus]|uniref:Uncharacterized protein n=1 Tax=Catharanthus roseus TaxID=4058 RepID=A0ACC0AVW9_CATRO|nr:hypothetical protein M9H77_22939 [Catharanthus roseus]
MDGVNRPNRLTLSVTGAAAPQPPLVASPLLHCQRRFRESLCTVTAQQVGREKELVHASHQVMKIQSPRNKIVYRGKLDGFDFRSSSDNIALKHVPLLPSLFTADSPSSSFCCGTAVSFLPLLLRLPPTAAYGRMEMIIIEL